jgi:hypothetical protein
MLFLCSADSRDTDREKNLQVLDSVKSERLLSATDRQSSIDFVSEPLNSRLYTAILGGFFRPLMSFAAPSIGSARRDHRLDSMATSGHLFYVVLGWLILLAFQTDALVTFISCTLT